jgi:hypothetical protein
MKADLQKRFTEMQQIEELVHNYRETKVVHLDELKKMAIYGVSRGAVKYLEALCECMQFEQNPDELPEDYEFQPEESHL